MGTGLAPARHQKDIHHHPIPFQASMVLPRSGCQRAGKARPGFSPVSWTVAAGPTISGSLSPIRVLNDTTPDDVAVVERRWSR
jgi:hypothetical protein